jgi:hypothetical protein
MFIASCQDGPTKTNVALDTLQKVVHVDFTYLVDLVDFASYRQLLQAQRSEGRYNALQDTLNSLDGKLIYLR